MDAEDSFEFSAAHMGVNVNNASRKISEFIYAHLPAHECGIAGGSFNSSHSCRIIGANHALFSAMGEDGVVRAWGGWRTWAAMRAYVDENTTRSQLWADFFYWLARGYNAFEYENGREGAMGDDEPV